MKLTGLLRHHYKKACKLAVGIRALSVWLSVLNRPDLAMLAKLLLKTNRHRVQSLGWYKTRGLRAGKRNKKQMLSRCQCWPHVIKISVVMLVDEANWVAWLYPKRSKRQSTTPFIANHIKAATL